MRRDVPLNQNAPILRFGRWLESLSLLDVLVIGVVSPVLGLASVIGPALLTAPQKPASYDLLWYSIENIAFGRTIICLFFAGVIVALLSRRLGAWAASTAMAGYVLMTIGDLVSGKPGHNLLPFELAIYALLTGFTMAAATVVALVRG